MPVKVKSALLAAALVAVLALRPVAAAKVALPAEYLARIGDSADGCDFFVHFEEGNDGEEGSEIDYPLKTLDCAVDPNCNNGLDASSVVCVHEGTVEVYDTIRPKAKFLVTVRGLGSGVVLDGMGRTQIMNSGRTPVVFSNFVWTNGFGTTGAGIYGEGRMEFHNCSFIDNEASTDAAAAMISREAHFYGTTFKGNKAKWGGAARTSDIASATFTDCKFLRNTATDKGGAMVVQIEKPDEHTVVLTDTIFCLNASPNGKHIYNFRDAAHTCTNCQFNSAACCSDHGHVVASDDPPDDDGVTHQVCDCEAGFTGEFCENGSADDGNGDGDGDGKDEL